MRTTDFSKDLTAFLTRYLPGERGASPHTIASYRDTFVLFLVFAKERKGVAAERLTLAQITKDLVVEFLGWLQTERHSSAPTRNVRLAALHSFVRYLQYQHPEHLAEWQRILGIPVKRTEKPVISYLSVEGIRLLLQGPDVFTRSGRRDLALLSLMYDSGARVQEMIDLTPSMIRLDPPSTVKLIGKGHKARIVPLLEQEVTFLRRYMTEQQLLEPYATRYPLFSNSRHEKLTRAGVNYILTKYANQARLKESSLIPTKLSCHGLRHSKAMHLLQSGVNLVYIRDILGHSSVQVTEIYARADSRQKREAIEQAYAEVSPQGVPPWEVNKDLLSWLKSFNK